MSRDFQLAHRLSFPLGEPFPFDLPRMGIYAIQSTLTGQVYVGQSRRIRGRWRDHIKELTAGRGSPKLQKDWDLHGPKCFKFILLEKVTDPVLLKEREQYFMDGFDVCVMGYNTLPTAGSFKGYTPNAEARAKIGAASKKRWEDPDFRERVLCALRGSDYTPTKDHLRKISEALRGVKKGSLPDDHRENISKALKGRTPVAACAAWTGQHHSEETKRKIGEANRGKCRSEHVRLMLKNRKHTEETKAKISMAMKGKPWSVARRAAHEKRQELGGNA